MCVLELIFSITEAILKSTLEASILFWLRNSFRDYEATPLCCLQELCHSPRLHSVTHGLKGAVLVRHLSTRCQRYPTVSEKCVGRLTGVDGRAVEGQEAEQEEQPE